MREWEESTVKGSIAAPAAGQGGMAMPPPGPPRAGHGRGVLVVGLVVVLLALGGGAYLFVRSRDHKSAPSNQVAAVRQAYLTWWNARVQAYLTLNPAPMKPYMTAAGYQQEEGRLAQQQATGNPFQLVATHSLNVFVYSVGNYASVDDLWADQSVALDPATHAPIGQPAGLTVEDSTTLKKVQGRWLVDDLGRFGVSQSVDGQVVSYAAVNAASPPDRSQLEMVENAFQKYQQIRDAAFLSLNPVPLPEIEGGAELTADQAHMERQIVADQPVKFVDQDSYRIAFQDPTSAWIYDTVGDQSETLSAKTRAPVGRAAFKVMRATYGLTKGSNGWVVDFFGGN